MTLIAYKDGVICADSQKTAGALVTGRPCLKIARRADGSLFGCSGYASVSLHWMRWFIAGERGEPPWRDTGEDFDAVMIVRQTGRIDYWATTQLSEEAADDRLGLGYSSYLHGLMDAGLSSTDAVKRALRRYRSAGYPLIELRHAGPLVIWASETERGDPAEFFAACGVAPGEFIQEPAQIVMAA